MKTNLLKAFAIAIAMTSFYNCSVEPIDDLSPTSGVSISELPVTAIQEEQAFDCDGTIPRARIINNGTVAFDYSIYDSSTGVFITTIYDIAPGTTTDWTDFAEGSIIFNLENGIDRDQKVLHLMENCTEINMEIDVNNLLTTSVPQAISN